MSVYYRDDKGPTCLCTIEMLLTDLKALSDLQSTARCEGAVQRGVIQTCTGTDTGTLDMATVPVPDLSSRNCVST